MSKMITTRDKAVTDIVDEQQKKRHLDLIKAKSIRSNWQALRNVGFGLAMEARPSAELDYDEGRMLNDVLPDDSWKGQRCFIIGGGESLKDFDFSKLKNELVIGVNRAFEKMDCTVNFAMDHSLYQWITQEKLGPETKKKFENFKGYPVWLDSAGYDYPKGIFILSKSDGRTFSYKMESGIGGGTNSGFGALNLAICLGANPIYLLGFDMYGSDGKQSWWHSGYPDKRSDKIYAMFKNDFKRIALEMRQKGIRIVNLNPKSELRCFEFGDIDKLKPIDRPIIASYYTKGTEYETQVQELKTTLRRFNLESDIIGINDLGDWYKNTYFKSQFVLNTLKKYPHRSVVFVDADAIFRQSPFLFSDFDCDFAYHFYNRKELLGGTLYFGNGKGARFVAKKWVEIDELKKTTHMPQKNLQALFKEIKDEIKWKELPLEYCMIFDCHQRRQGAVKLEPVIEHFQLSRKHKDPNLKKASFRLKSGVVAIQKLCKDKNMCIIGNANSILSKKRNIDSFDIVGRMNRGRPAGKEEYIGSRTDILFLSTGMSRKSIEVAYGQSLKFPEIALPIVWMTAEHRLAHPWVIRNAIQNPKKDWKELYKKLGINPTTGLMTLKFVLKYLDFKSLTIFGFDFFTTKTWYNTRPDSGKKHSGGKERVLFMKMIKGRQNVRFVS